MDQHFIEQLENLTLLSQNWETSDLFNSEYERLLGEVTEMMKGMKALAVIQAAWLQTQQQMETVQ